MKDLGIKFINGGIQSQISSKTIYHECSIDFEYKSGRESLIEFTVTQMYDANTDSSTYEIELLSEIGGNVDENELRKQLLEMFKKDNV
jgi:hypothetical protein